jgi:hypothetical protein
MVSVSAVMSTLNDANVGAVESSVYAVTGTFWPNPLLGTFSVWAEFMVRVKVRVAARVVVALQCFDQSLHVPAGKWSGRPRGRSLVTRMYELQAAEQRRWHPPGCKLLSQNADTVPCL